MTRAARCAVDLSRFVPILSLSVGHCARGPSQQQKDLSHRRPESSAACQKDGPRINGNPRPRSPLTTRMATTKSPSPCGRGQAAQEPASTWSRFRPTRRRQSSRFSTTANTQYQEQRKPRRARSKDRRGQGTDVPADDRRSRLRREAAIDERFFETATRSGHLALPRPRDGAPGSSGPFCSTGQGR